MASSDILPKSAYAPGQKIRFTCDPANTPYKIKAVSEFVDMVKIEDGGWCWTYGIAPVEEEEPDALKSSLDFLAL